MRRPAGDADNQTRCRAHENARRNCWERSSERSAAGLDVIAACLVRSGANPARAVKLSPGQRRRCRDHSQPRLTDPTAPSGKTKCMRGRRAAQRTCPRDSRRTRLGSPPTSAGCGRQVDSWVRPSAGQYRWAGRTDAETPGCPPATGRPSPDSHPDGVRRQATVWQAARDPVGRRIATGCPPPWNLGPTTSRRPAGGGRRPRRRTQRHHPGNPAKLLLSDEGVRGANAIIGRVPLPARSRATAVGRASTSTLAPDAPGRGSVVPAAAQSL